jgi:TatD DNase family protein
VIDSHCHVDQFSNPEAVAVAAEKRRIFTVAVTNLPSHYEIAKKHLACFRYVVPALGLHPLAERAPKELSRFLRNVPTATCIGEIGLDFSRHGIATKAKQLKCFEAAVDSLEKKRRFITLHSRGAENEVLEILRKREISPVVFHWFSGDSKTFKEVIAEGHALSFNTAMIKTDRWKREFADIPRDRVLIESDGPYVKTDGKPVSPLDLSIVVNWIAAQWKCTRLEAESIIDSNFRRLGLSPPKPDSNR